MTSQFLLRVLSADSSLGKVDKIFLSEQTLMELLVQGIENKRGLCGSNETPDALSEWKCVSFQDDSDGVIKLLWSNLSLEGSLELKWLPLTTKEAYFSTNKLSGTVDLACLPDDLQALSLSVNLFEGTVDLTQLPQAMRCLFLYRNNFFGKTDFSHLPKSLQHLDVSSTQLEGEVFFCDGQLHTKGSNVRDMRKK